MYLYPSLPPLSSRVRLKPQNGGGLVHEYENDRALKENGGLRIHLENISRNACGSGDVKNLRNVGFDEGDELWTDRSMIS